MDEKVLIQNENGVANSLQVSYLANVSAGDFKPGRAVLIKNITDNPISLSVKLVNNSDFVTTTIYPGWNPELIIEIENVSGNTIQYGY